MINQRACISVRYFVNEFCRNKDSQNPHATVSEICVMVWCSMFAGVTCFDHYVHVQKICVSCQTLYAYFQTFLFPPQMFCICVQNKCLWVRMSCVHVQKYRIHFQRVAVVYWLFSVSTHRWFVLVFKSLVFMFKSFALVFQHSVPKIKYFVCAFAHIRCSSDIVCVIKCISFVFNRFVSMSDDKRVRVQTFALIFRRFVFTFFEHSCSTVLCLCANVSCPCVKGWYSSSRRVCACSSVRRLCTGDCVGGQTFVLCLCFN